MELTRTNLTIATHKIGDIGCLNVYRIRDIEQSQRQNVCREG